MDARDVPKFLTLRDVLREPIPHPFIVRASLHRDRVHAVREEVSDTPGMTVTPTPHCVVVKSGNRISGGIGFLSLGAFGDAKTIGCPTCRQRMTDLTVPLRSVFRRGSDIRMGVYRRLGSVLPNLRLHDVRVATCLSSAEVYAYLPTLDRSEKGNWQFNAQTLLYSAFVDQTARTIVVPATLVRTVSADGVGSDPDGVAETLACIFLENLPALLK